MTKKQKHFKDPHANREASRYDSPIASREAILDFLNKQSSPALFSDIASTLDVDETQHIALERRLFAMQRDGQIDAHKNGTYAAIKTEHLLSGTIISHKDGYGFVKLDTPVEGISGDVFVNQREMRKVFDGDKVLIEINQKGRKSKRGQAEATIKQVTEANTTQLVAKLLVDKERCRAIPENPKYQHRILIDTDKSVNAPHESIVIVEITRQPNSFQAPKGIIKQILGESGAPGLEIEIALRDFDIPHEWPDAVTQQVNKLQDEPSDADKITRVDIRHLPLVTIDGEDARDFDDAVYCEKKNSGGWRLWVAIADVSHYVSLNSALDEEAYKRSTSVYFPQRVIPMLPEKISNELCSLKPNVDRLCMVCEMTISATGNLSGYQFYEAVMHSHARLTYTEVGQMIDERDDSGSLTRQSFSNLLPAIDELHNLYQTLLAKRKDRGAINFETQETRFVFNEQRKIEAVVPIVRNDAHKLIEECMLLANVATAKFLSKYELDTLYRVHEGPNEKKLENLKNFLKEKGLFLQGEKEPSPEDYGALLQQIQTRDDANVIQTMLLRSMSQAVYQPENKGHFGLAYKAYAHFTSPIRRYPDLLVHRAIRAALYDENCKAGSHNKNIKRLANTPVVPFEKAYPYNLEAMLAFGEQTSMAERRADEATRDVSAWLKCEYLSHHIGEVYSGRINAVASFGMFIELDDLLVEGMVHVSQLGDEFFHFEADKQRLIGERSHRVFNLGDKVVVLIDRVELDNRRVHLSIVEQKPGRNNQAPNDKPAHKKVRKRSTHKSANKGDKPAAKHGKKTATKKKSSGKKHATKLAKSSSKKSGAKRKKR